MENCSTSGVTMVYVNQEQHEAFVAKNETIIRKIVETLKGDSLTLDAARRILTLVERKISQEAKI